MTNYFTHATKKLPHVSRIALAFLWVNLLAGTLRADSDIQSTGSDGRLSEGTPQCSASLSGPAEIHEGRLKLVGPGSDLPGLMDTRLGTF